MGTGYIYNKDQHSGTSFLVDTGAQRLILPATQWDRQGHKGEGLKAANQTNITTYGTRMVMLKFGNKLYEHEFTIADLPHRYLGMDFFKANGISIDAERQELFKRKDVVTICEVTEDAPAQGGPGPVQSKRSEFKCDPDQQEFYDLLDSFPDVLTPNFHAKENKHNIEHYIETKGHPVFAKPRRLDQAKLEAARAEFAELERLGIIRRSNSPWSSPLHVVPKANGKLRPCGDYRRLNEMTVDDKYPLPHIHDFNEELLGATIFSKVDLIRGYHQVPVAKDDIKKTAIVTPFGLWEYDRMPFGLKNSAQAFQRLMDGIFGSLPFVFVYLDDLLIASKSAEEHEVHLKTIFKLLEDNSCSSTRPSVSWGSHPSRFLATPSTPREFLQCRSELKPFLTFLARQPRNSSRAFLAW